MTPLHLDILLHWFVSREDFKPKSDVANIYIMDLVKKGYLYSYSFQETDDDEVRNIYQTTEYGKRMIEKILLVLDNQLTTTIKKENK